MLLLRKRLSSGSLLTRCLVAAIRNDLAPRTNFFCFSSESFSISWRVCSPISNSEYAKWFSTTSKRIFASFLAALFTRRSFLMNFPKGTVRWIAKLIKKVSEQEVLQSGKT